MPVHSARDHRRRVGVLLLLLLGGAACADSAPAAPDPEAAPRAFLEQIVDIMEERSYRRYEIDWTMLRDSVLSVGAGAQALDQTMPAVAVALTLLADNHSWFRRPNGMGVSYPRSISCTAAAAPNPVRPPDIGYLRVIAFGGSSAESGVYTGTLQDAMRIQDSDSLVGWIIDLRGNTGGNMWPMLAALWPFLQGVTGHFVTADSVWSTWSVDGPRSYLGATSMAEARAPYQPIAADRRIAVLLDGRVASSGEATAIAFRGRANTRSFGTPSCGLSTGIGAIPVGDGYLFGLAQVKMADRDSVIFGGVVMPDEVIEGADAQAARAIAWLRTGQ